MAKNKEQSTRKKVVSRLITIISLAVFLYASYGLFDAFQDYYQNRKMLSSLQDIYYSGDTFKENETEGNTIRSGFDELLKQNENVVGWITVEGTQIDYPILQSDNNIDYLTENFYGEQSRAGSVFLDYRNDIMGDNENTIVYGHRMKDGSMFQHLVKFLDRDFFETHRTFEFDTLYNKYEAEVFAVYNTLTDFNYIQTDFSTAEEYEQLLTNIKEKSRFTADVEITKDDQIITLSTCDYELDQNDGRLVVHAKLTEIN